MPNLTAAEREFRQTGTTSEEWEEAMGDPEERDNEKTDGTAAEDGGTDPVA